MCHEFLRPFSNKGFGRMSLQITVVIAIIVVIVLIIKKKDACANLYGTSVCVLLSLHTNMGKKTLATLFVT